MSEHASAVGGYFDSAGNPLSDEQLHEAWQQGAAHVQAGTKVPMLNAEGLPVLVPAEQVSQAHARGYMPQTQAEHHELALQKEHGGLGGQAAAFGEGALRGATVGLSDVAARAVAPEYADSMNERREANPVSAGVGQAVGVIAPAVLTGGGSLAEEGAIAGAEGAEAAGAGAALAGAGEAAEATSGLSALGTAARAISAPIRATGQLGHLVAHGVERGLASLGYEGATLAGRVGAKALTAAAAGTAEGAIFGVGEELSESALEGKDITAEHLVSSIGRNALFGGALGAGFAAASELGGAAIKAAMPKPETLEKFARKQALRTVGSGADIARLGEKADMTADELLGYTFKTGELKGKRMFSMARNAEDMLENVKLAKAETGAMKGGIVREIDAAIQSNPEVAAIAAPDVAELTQRIRAEVIDPLRASSVPQVQRSAAPVERLISNLEQDIAARAEAAASGVANDVAPAAPTFAELDKFKRDLQSVIYPKSPKGGGIALAPKSAGELQKAERILLDFQDNAAQKALAAMGEDPAAYATLNRQYSALSSLEQMAKKTANRMNTNRMVSPTDHALGLGSAMMAMLSGNVGALPALAIGGAGAAVNKVLRERGNSVLADIAHRVSKMDNLVEATAHALSVSPERLTLPIEIIGETAHHQGRERLAASDYVPLGIAALSKDFGETKERVEHLANPENALAQMTHATSDIAAHYPAQAVATQQKLAGLVQYLTQELPKGQGGSIVTPVADPPRVSPREQQRYLTKVNAALHPEGVLRDLQRGQIDRDAVAALKAVYPDTFKRLQTKVVSYTAASKNEIPFQKRIALSVVFDFVGDSSLDPARGTALQQSIAQFHGQPPGGGSSGGVRQSKISKAFELPGSGSGVGT